MKTSLNDYITQFGQGDDTIALINSRNMLNIEELRNKTEEDNWEEKFKSHKDQRDQDFSNYRLTTTS